MAQLPSFPPFSIHSSEQSAGVRWKRWVEKFENLICALNIKDDKRKKALFLHYVGEEAYDIYDSLTNEQKGIGAMIGDDSNEYEVLKKSMTDYFTPKQNTTYEIFKFRQASQNIGETVDSYYTRLRTLASTCDFHNVDQEILSQIIQGCTSSRVRRRALRDNYTLEKVIDEARALELSEKRAADIESKNAHAANSLSQNNPRTGVQKQKRQHQRQDRNSNGAKPKVPQSKRNYVECRNCGRDFSHKRCPALGQECHFCKKKNHFAKVCRSKQNSNKQVNLAQSDVRELKSEHCDSSSDESLFNIHKHNSQVPSVTVKMLNSEIHMLIDTGASVNIISHDVFKGIPHNAKPTLKTQVPLIYAYGSTSPLNVRGCFTCRVCYKNKEVLAEFYVFENNDSRHSHCLLGATTAQQLNIVHFAFSSVTNTSQEKHASLFDGNMGKIKDVKIKLHIDQSVKPVSQRHRRVPFHVRKDVEKELKRLEKLDVIEPVSGPTPWVSPVVVVPKKSSGVRVCIDMREANKAIKREEHPMPTVDDLISDLNYSTVSSKLDLSNAYHQLELDESCRYITTFSTHVGLRHINASYLESMLLLKFFRKQ